MPWTVQEFKSSRFNFRLPFCPRCHHLRLGPCSRNILQSKASRNVSFHASEWATTVTVRERGLQRIHGQQDPCQGKLKEVVEISRFQQAHTHIYQKKIRHRRSPHSPKTRPEAEGLAHRGGWESHARSQVPSWCIGALFAE